MARGKVQMKKIENPVHRQVTFCKRRTGLLKKARELSVLCDAHIGLIIFSPHGKMFELATKGSMQELIGRYVKSSGGVSQTGEGGDEQLQDLAEEVSVLKQEIEFLHKGLRYMLGGGVENMNLDELNALERHLEVWIYHIRSTKMQVMYQEIQLLKNKEAILKTANEILQEHIGDQNKFFDEPTIANMPYPLTIQNEIFQF